MPSSLLWPLGLAALLLAAVRRYIRPRSSWTAFRANALTRAACARREAQRATEAISDVEALQPLRAALRDTPPPSGVSLRELDAGPAEVRVLVTSSRASLMLRLVHSPYRRTRRPPASPAGVWRLAIHLVSAAEGSPMPGAALPEESFDDLAACAARLQTLVADPASARRSVHAHSD